MKTESDKSGLQQDEYPYKIRRNDTRSNEPPQLVLSIKESVHQLRKLFEEKRARDAENGIIPNQSFNIPLNFRFKSIMELSQAVRNKFVDNHINITKAPVPEIRTTTATLHQEQKVLSVKDVAYCNGNGYLHNKRKLDEPAEVHKPEEVQRISALINDFHENDSELEKARRQIVKLQEQILSLQEARAQLEKEKTKLTKVNFASEIETKEISEQATTSFGSSTSKSVVVTDDKFVRRTNSKTAWRRVKKTSGRVCFGILQACF